MGVTGVGLATILTCALNMIFVSLYTWKYSTYPVEIIPTADKGNTLKTLLKVRDVYIYLRISGPLVVMLFAEWMAYQVITIFAASISSEATIANAISQNYLNLIYCIPFGFQLGGMAVIGNIIGEENENVGRMMSIVTIFYSSCSSIVCAACTYIFADQIAAAFTSTDLEIVSESLQSLSFPIALIGIIYG